MNLFPSRLWINKSPISNVNKLELFAVNKLYTAYRIKKIIYRLLNCRAPNLGSSSFIIKAGTDCNANCCCSKDIGMNQVNKEVVLQF